MDNAFRSRLPLVDDSVCVAHRRMFTLINTNRMLPPIAPIGLDYLADAVRAAGREVELIDLCLADDPRAALESYFTTRQPDVVGLSFRNVDDCFWPSAQSFLPMLREDVQQVRRLTDAPIVLGGVGYSMFARQLVEYTDADFGIHGDGEQALPALADQLAGGQRWERVPGLVYRENGALRANRPAWPSDLALPARRALVDNAVYFRQGGQIGVETKRGCRRRCLYCADPIAKGPSVRLRDPAHVADEVELLAAQGIDVLHLCDAEFNLPLEHARDVCDALIQRGLGNRVRWYAYLAVSPFPADLARQMQRAGCVGIDFTADSADPAMLVTYRHGHREKDLADAVRLCREHGMAVMLDMLLGGPGESPESVARTIESFKRLDPDCAGAALGIRIYPGTPLASLVRTEGPLDSNPNIRRRYPGPVDWMRPTFYISAALGDRPERLVRELIGGDPRFFGPADPPSAPSGNARDDHNYNDNRLLIEAILGGARGAYWDILRQLRCAR